MNKDEAKARFQAAVASYRAGKPEEALHTLDPVVRAYPTHANSHYARAKCLASLGRTQEARIVGEFLANSLGDPRGAELLASLDPGQQDTRVDAPVVRGKRARRAGHGLAGALVMAFLRRRPKAEGVQHAEGQGADAAMGHTSPADPAAPLAEPGGATPQGLEGLPKPFGASSDATLAARTGDDASAYQTAGAQAYGTTVQGQPLGQTVRARRRKQGLLALIILWLLWPWRRKRRAVAVAVVLFLIVGLAYTLRGRSAPQGPQEQAQVAAVADGVFIDYGGNGGPVLRARAPQSAADGDWDGFSYGAGPHRVAPGSELELAWNDDGVRRLDPPRVKRIRGTEWRPEELRSIDIRNLQLGPEEAALIRSLPNLEKLHLPSVRPEVPLHEILSGQNALTSLVLRGARDRKVGIVFPGASTGSVGGVAHSVGYPAIGAEEKAAIFEMPALRILDLGNFPYSAEDLGALAKIVTLEELHADLGRSGGDGIAHLANLPNLRLLTTPAYHNEGSSSSSGLAEEHVPLLANLTSLERLTLYVTFYESGYNEVTWDNPPSLTDEGIQALSTLTRLKTLSIPGQKRVTDKGLAALSALTELESLDISALIEVTDDGFASLSALPNLRELNLSHTKITGDGLRRIAAGSDIISLDLSQVKMTPAEFAALAEFPKLMTLEMWGGDFRHGELEGLLALPSLERLIIPASVLDARSLEALHTLSDRVAIEVNYAIADAAVLAKLQELHGQPATQPGQYMSRTQEELVESGFQNLGQAQPYVFVDFPEGPPIGRVITERVGWNRTREEEITGRMFFQPQVRKMDLEYATESPQSLAVLEPLAFLADLTVRGGVLEAESLRSLGALERLRTLRIEGATLQGDAPWLDALRVETLSLNGTRLGPAGVEGLNGDGLAVLDLSGCTITRDALEQAIEGTGSLRELHARGLPLDDELLARLLEKNPDLKVLDLSETKVGEAGLLSLAGHPNLHTIRVQRLPVTDALLEEWASIPGLAELDLGRTPITGEGLKHLAEKEIARLSVEYAPNFDARTLQHLRRDGKGLLGLNLRGTKIRDRDLDRLPRSVNRMRYINLSETQVTAEGLTALAERVKVGSLYALKTTKDDPRETFADRWGAIDPAPRLWLTQDDFE